MSVSSVTCIGCCVVESFAPALNVITTICWRIFHGQTHQPNHLTINGPPQWLTRSSLSTTGDRHQKGKRTKTIVSFNSINNNKNLHNLVFNLNKDHPESWLEIFQENNIVETFLLPSPTFEQFNYHFNQKKNLQFFPIRKTPNYQTIFSRTFLCLELSNILSSWVPPLITFPPPDRRTTDSPFRRGCDHSKCVSTVVIVGESPIVVVEVVVG